MRHPHDRAADLIWRRRNHPCPDSLPWWVDAPVEAMLLMTVICWGMLYTALTGDEDY